MPASKFFGLVLCNVLWSGVYAASKSLFANYHPLEVSFLRYLSGGIPLLIYCLWGGRRSLLGQWVRGIRRFDGRIVLIGLLTFFVTPLSQMTGLRLSRSIDSALMIATEPLFTVLAACIVLRERLRLVQIVSLVVALFGACILTDVTWDKLFSFSDSRLIGNSIFLISMLSEAAYSVVAKPIVDRRSPILIMTVSLWIGIALLFAHNMIVDGPSRLSGLAPLFNRGDWTDWAGILYQGLGCTAFSYLFWMMALADTPVSIMAVTLYIQPVLGTLWGYLFLGEVITATTFIGAFLILAAVWLGSHPPRQKKATIASIA